MSPLTGDTLSPRSPNNYSITSPIHKVMTHKCPVSTCRVSTGLPGADKLEMYPLVVAVTDGRVQRVCSHPDDDTWAINMKKGVASAFQISVPSLSSTNSGLNFTEVTSLYLSRPSVILTLSYNPPTGGPYPNASYP